MPVINVFLTSGLGDTLEDFEHGGCRIVFARLRADSPRPVVDGTVWIFVDWVMDDLAGLEMCRRLRADPRTADAHVTMVLESDDPDDRRRALKAGADDYLVGPLDRTRVLVVTREVVQYPTSPLNPVTANRSDMSVTCPVKRFRASSSKV